VAVAAVVVAALGAHPALDSVGLAMREVLWQAGGV